jgi:hypothetical protein
MLRNASKECFHAVLVGFDNQHKKTYICQCLMNTHLGRIFLLFSPL